MKDIAEVMVETGSWVICVPALLVFVIGMGLNIVVNGWRWFKCVIALWADKD